MEQFLAKVAEVNGVINTFVWVTIGLALLLGTGVICTIVTNGFQSLGHDNRGQAGAVIERTLTDLSNATMEHYTCNVLTIMECIRIDLRNGLRDHHRAMKGLHIQIEIAIVI